MNTTRVFLEMGKNGTWGACSLDLEHYVIIGEGKTIKAAKADFMVGYKEVLEIDENDIVWPEIYDLTFEWVYDIYSLTERYPLDIPRLIEKAKITPHEQGEFASEEDTRKVLRLLRKMGKEMAGIK